ncbi:MAG TPA: hypothetical protein VNJ06_06765 [Gemmatimonadales bacterium]|nr:hypothetical protein [Gemmatimonadales bacterium]
MRRFVDKVIVESRLLDTAALQGVDHRSHFGLHQVQDRSPINIAVVSSVCLNATHEPDASAGRTVTAPTVT